MLGVGCHASPGRRLIRGVLVPMRLPALLFTAVLVAAPVWAQQPSPSTHPDASSSSKDQKSAAVENGDEAHLPVSLDKIRQGLQQTPELSFRSLDERPIFRIQIDERRKIEELIASLDFKTGPTPAGGVYMAEQQRLMFNPVDHPLMQPYAGFSESELLTILIENVVGRFLGGKLGNAVSKVQRSRAEALAREDVDAAIAEYCRAQTDFGAGRQICANLQR